MPIASRAMHVVALVLVAIAASGCASDAAEQQAVELMQEGVEAGQAGDLEAAATLLEQAAETRPGFIDPLMFLANVRERQGDYSAARDAYRRALQTDPTFTRAGVALAQAYIAERRFSEARTWLHRCVDMDPGSVPAFFNLGILAEDDGDTATALQWYRLAAVMNVWATPPILHEGRIHLAEGRIDDAKNAAERAYTRDPNDRAVYDFVQAIRATERRLPPLPPRQ